VAGAGGCIDHTIATPTGAGTDPTKLGSPGRGVAVSPGPPLGLGRSLVISHNYMYVSFYRSDGRVS